MYQVNAWAPDKVVAIVDTKVGVNNKDVWNSKSKAGNGAGQSYYYTWNGNSSSAASHMRVSDY